MLYRSKFNTIFDIFTVIYDCKSLKMDGLIRKAKLSNAYQRAFIDLLVVNGLVGVSNSNFIYLTDEGERVASDLIPPYKKIVSFYKEHFEIMTDNRESL